MKRTYAVATAILAAASGQAQIHDGDIAVGLNDGVITTGTESNGSGVITSQQCVFGAEFGSQARTTDPGFDTDLGVFQPDTDIAYFIRKALRKWDGTDFDSIPPEKVRISFGPVFGISTPDTDPAQPIEGVYTGTSGGEWHVHYAFRLELDGSPATGASSDGVYLLEFELRDISGAYVPSDPIWLVISEGADQQTLEDAIAYANSEYSCGGDVCIADVNGDGQLSPTDFTAWIAAFNTNDPSADQNGDGQITPTDFTAWIANYNAGC
ncbi:MAG: hypothetical protein Phyf2KO_09560 [Phycisphaerales bacterium]